MLSRSCLNDFGITNLIATLYQHILFSSLVNMRGVLLPRYLRVAQWLFEQQRPVSSREIAKIFNVSSWAISSDFVKICRQSDIFECRETKEVTNKSREHTLHILFIHAYTVDKRGVAELDDGNSNQFNVQKTWQILISKPWEKVASLIH